jgi:hypothetical protein
MEADFAKKVNPRVMLMLMLLMLLSNVQPYEKREVMAWLAFAGISKLERFWCFPKLRTVPGFLNCYYGTSILSIVLLQ